MAGRVCVILTIGERLLFGTGDGNGSLEQTFV